MTDLRTRQDEVPDRSAARRRHGRVWRRLLVLVLLLVALPAVSVAQALAAPGTDSTAARLAEWARSHHLSGLVDQLERRAYRAPAVGGRPAQGSPLVAGPAGGGSPAPGASPVPGPVAPAPPVDLPAVTPPVSPALPGEGTWRTVSVVAGQPAVQEAFVRPDAVHTSYTAGLAWMDPTLVRFVLHPGTDQPGHGPWTTSPALVGADRTGLLAAFNGGFRLDAARGGFYAEGRTVGALRDGAASLVIGSDGTARVVQWGRDAGLGPDVAAVRQNLDLLVDGGQVAPGLTDNAGGRWGATLGNKYYVWRSGVGQTAGGALVYAAGNGLSAQSLADLLQRAGCVRAMELDINPEWTSFVTYPQTANLLPDMQRSPHRYDTTSTRDFVAVVSRTP